MIKFGDYYHKYESIGKGSYSHVYKGYHNDIKNKIYAIKEINIKKNIDNINRFYLEIDIMKKIKHQNIITLYDTIINDDYIYIVMEYCKYGDLRKFLKNKKINEYKAQIIMKQLVSGLKYLYDNNIFHRDLKPQNILVAENCIIKITDFGLAKECENNNLSDTICGSPIYMAPEIIQKTKYNNKADIWSLGIILYELLTGSSPYNINNFNELVDYIKNNNIEIPENLNISDNAKNLLSNLLIKSSEERITWKNIFNHPWLTNNLTNSYLFKSKILNTKNNLNNNLLNTQNTLNTLNTKYTINKSNKINNSNKLEKLDEHNNEHNNENNNEHNNEHNNENKYVYNNYNNHNNHNNINYDSNSDSDNELIFNNSCLEDSFDNNCIFSIELSNYNNKNNKKDKNDTNNVEDSFFNCSYHIHSSDDEDSNIDTKYDIINDSLSKYDTELEYIKKQDDMNPNIKDSFYNILHNSKIYINSIIYNSNNKKQ